MDITLDDADRLAVEAHGTTTMVSGGLFIDHARRVAAHFDVATDPDAALAAILHDTVEKGTLTFDDLRDAGVAEYIVEIVDALTERDGETERSYLTRCALHPVALRVKRVDIADKFPSRAALRRAAVLEEIAATCSVGSDPS